MIDARCSDEAVRPAAPASRFLVRLAAVALASVVVASVVLAEEGEDPAPKPAAESPPTIGTREGPGVGREQMWPAPTRDDWQKPVLLTFQRTWDDAVAVAKEAGKPILVCINMDGEIASEHYAGIRYRQPEVAALYEPYVCVIASVYRHNPRDHDDEGNRILCPRFGSVTCGEHITIEPVIFEKFCDGRRIAPRHIAVDLEDNEAFDVYYVDDTAGVFDSIRDGRSKFPPAPATVVRGDRPILERVASRHVTDRTAVEAAYRRGDPGLRRSLLDAALEHKDANQLDLLRMAVFGLDVDLGQKARQALAEVETPAATTLISDALRVPMDTAERDSLIAALKRLGQTSTLARWLAGVHQGLAAGSSAVDPKGWAEAPAGRAGDSPTTVTPRSEDENLDWEAERRAREAYERPEDPSARLDFAEAMLALARETGQTHAYNPRTARMFARQLYADAKRAALDAEHLGLEDWRVQTVLALAAYYSDDLEEAYARAAEAVKELPPGEPGWNSMAVVTVFAESRWKAIKTAVQAKKEWPASWLADLHAAYSLLMRHPLGTDGQVVWHYEFLVWLGAEHRASRVLREGVARFPGSPALHQRLRDRVLERRGAEALEPAYDRLIEREGDSPLLASYAGLAAVTAAESHRRTQKLEQAMESYASAIAHYERAGRADAAYAEVMDPAIALVHAARARVALQFGDYEAALREILASFDRSPGTAGTRDGMGINPAETAQMLLERLKRASQADEAARLAGALEKLDPELLRPDRGLLGDDAGR